MATLALTYTDTELSFLFALPQGFRRGRIQLPEGLVSNGTILDPDNFATQLKQALASRSITNFNQINVVVGLPEEHTFIKAVSIPKSIKAKELQNAFSYQWRSIMPIAVEDVYYESVSLADSSKKSPNRRYLIVAYPKVSIESVIAALQKSGLTVTRLIPLSFGLAELFSAKKPIATLVINSQDGKTISVAVIEKGTTRLSTVIHARTDSASAYKQIETIKNFYNQTNAEYGDAINHILIVRSQWADALAQQLAGLSLPIEMSEAGQLLTSGRRGVKSAHVDPYNLPVAIEKTNQGLKIRGAGNYLYEGDAYLPLLGLVKSKSTFAIFPPAIQGAVQARIQGRAVRLLFGATVGLLIVVLPLSVWFLRNVQKQYATRVTIAPSLSTKIAKREDELNKQVTETNQLASRLNSLTAKRTDVATVLRAIQESAKSTPGITITTIVYSQERKTIVITGSRSDRQAIVRFVEQLKTVKGVSEPTPSLASFQAEGESIFDVTLTLAGAKS